MLARTGLGQVTHRISPGPFPPFCLRHFGRIAHGPGARRRAAPQAPLSWDFSTYGNARTNSPAWPALGVLRALSPSWRVCFSRQTAKRQEELRHQDFPQVPIVPSGHVIPARHSVPGFGRRDIRILKGRFMHGNLPPAQRLMKLPYRKRNSDILEPGTLCRAGMGDPVGIQIIPDSRTPAFRLPPSAFRSPSPTSHLPSPNLQSPISNLQSPARGRDVHAPYHRNLAENQRFSAKRSL